MISISRKLMLICFIIFFIPMIGWYFLVDYSELQNEYSDPALSVLVGQIRVKLLFVLFLGIMLLGVILYYLKSEIINPLTYLTQRAKSVREDPSPDDFQTDRTDEIGILSNTLHQTLTRLNDKIKLMSEFSSDLSHEFKIPLSSVRGSIELLMDGADSDKNDREKFYKNILRETERLDRMITELIELTRLDNDPHIFQFHPVNYLQLLETIIGDFQPLAQSKSLNIKKSFPPQPVIDLHIDKDKITQVIVNILDNAISWSKPADEIIVEVLVQDKKIITRIADQGPGINREIKDKIFNRYFTTRKGLKNTGIGLSLAKVIVEKHKGSIHVNNNSPQGVILEFILPIS